MKPWIAKGPEHKFPRGGAPTLARKIAAEEVTTEIAYLEIMIRDTQAFIARRLKADRELASAGCYPLGVKRPSAMLREYKARLKVIREETP